MNQTPTAHNPFFVPFVCFVVNGFAVERPQAPHNVSQSPSRSPCTGRKLAL
jgi:hypothetical protein